MILECDMELIIVLHTIIVKDIDNCGAWRTNANGGEGVQCNLETDNVALHCLQCHLVIGERYGDGNRVWSSYTTLEGDSLIDS